MHAFLCHETNFFCVSTTSGLLHDVFQEVSVHPIPIEICYGLLRYALTFLLGMCRDGDIYDVLSVSALGPNRA